MTRMRIQIQGDVQGVGFRPHVYSIAKKLALTGWVKNTAFGVAIEVQGEAVYRFLSNLQFELPPLAKIDSIETAEIPLRQEEFE